MSNFAFEPVPETFIDLQKNVLNKEIKTFNFALGNDTMDKEMLVSSDSKLSSLLLDNNHLADKKDCNYLCKNKNWL